jgi:glycosyltransferase involved in cell wall biosynthesis
LLADIMQRVDSASHHAIVIGSANDRELAAECGVDASAVLCPPRVWPLSGQHALRERVHMMEAQGARFDLIHAWTARSAALASFALPRTPRLFSVHVGVEAGSDWRARAVARVLRRRPVSVLAASQALLDAYAPPAAGSGWRAVLTPGADPSSGHFEERQTIRSRWASEFKIDEHAFVVGLLAEPITYSDVYTATIIAARLRISGRNVRLLVHPSASRRLLAQRLAREISMGELIVVADELAQPWRLAKGLDAAMILSAPTTTRTSSLPMLWALASGTPVVADAPLSAAGQSDSSFLIQDGIDGMLIDFHDLNAASYRIARLYDDRNLSARLGHAAKARVDSNHGLGEYCARLTAAYEHLVGRVLAPITSASTSPRQDANAPSLTSIVS